jgi:small subunit ribosomal protein S21
LIAWEKNCIPAFSQNRETILWLKNEDIGLVRGGHGRAFLICAAEILRCAHRGAGCLLSCPVNQHQWKDGTHVQVLVRDNNVDQALRALKKKMQREGIFREMKMRGHYEKPSEKRAREKAEAVRRTRKLARKRAQREGLLGGAPRAR